MPSKDQLRIMVVDDMSVSRGLVFNCFEQIGLKNLSYAVDGKQALEMLQKQPVHVVVSDYNMPGMDGLDLLKEIRSNPRTARIGFILLTGAADPTVIERGKKLGMNNFMKKPFEPARLKTCLEKVVGPLQ